VLVALESDAGVDVLEPLGKQLAMHIAAAFPLALDDRPASTRNRAGARALQILRPRRTAEKIVGKTGRDGIAKMVEGAIEEVQAKENALLSQALRHGRQDPGLRTSIAKAGKDAGATITLKDYVRFQLGEGIEKEESDFAAEVAATAGLTK
jgi:elongation factor Ts